MGIGISGIASTLHAVEGGGKCGEETVDGDTDAGGEGLGDAVEKWGCTWGSVAAVASAAFARAFDDVGPVWVEKDGAWWEFARLAIHAEFMEAVQLQAFGIEPIGPSG